MSILSENIYANYDAGIKPPRSRDSTQKGSESKPKKFHGTHIFVYLGIVCVLLAGIIGLAVYNHKMMGRFAKLLSFSQANLTEFQIKNTFLMEEIKRLEKPTCPEKWKMFPGCRHCYYVSTETKAWAESRQDCQHRGADLVVIDSLEKQNLLSEITRGKDLFWIGLSDRDTEGDWKWVNDNPLNTEYWKGQQPDNWENEDCATIITGMPGRNWNDLSCDNTVKWMCEKKV